MSIRLSLVIPEALMEALDRHTERRNQAGIVMPLSRSEVIREGLVALLQHAGDLPSEQQQGSTPTSRTHANGAAATPLRPVPTRTPGTGAMDCPKCEAGIDKRSAYCPACGVEVGPMPACGSRQGHNERLAEDEECGPCEEAGVNGVGAAARRLGATAMGR